MSTVTKMANVGLFALVLMLASASMTAHAMSKDEAIKECLPTVGLTTETAEQCKANGWTGDCEGKKAKLKQCVMGKM